MKDQPVSLSQPVPAKRFSLSEDWTAVMLAFLIIGAALSGIVMPSPSFSWDGTEGLASKFFTVENMTLLLTQFLAVFAISCIGTWIIGKRVSAFTVVLPVVYFITVVALLIAGNSSVKSINLEAVIFSLALGLLIGNLFRLPEWFRSALSTELFVKIGLVILGTSIIISDVLKAGSYGLAQALIVVLSVWYFAYWFCRKLKVDEEMRMMIASAVSICGVSAAIATSGAIRGDNKKLSYVISLVLITAIPMMIFMPYLAKYMNLSQAVAGAWLGGSIDTTGAVVASGTLVGEEALRISTIVKFSQNVLLGIAAFAISIYWTYSGNGSQQEKPTLRIIWSRFPKFVIGFILASVLFSFLPPGSFEGTVRDSLKNMQSLWFTLAFTSIGLETNFRDLFRQENRRPLYGFLVAQVFNIIITLLIAYLLFG